MQSLSPEPSLDGGRRPVAMPADCRTSASPAARPAAADVTGCASSVVLAALVYLTALGAAAFLDAKTPILDGVSLYLVAAALLCFYGRVVFPQADRLVLLMEGACIVVALGLSLACLSYLGPMTDWPLRDREMIWIDRHLGLDWLQVMRGFDGRPLLLTILNAAYATFTAQLIGTALVLIAAGRKRELDCFFVTFLSASVLAELASVLIPTLGPMVTLARDVSFLHVRTIGRVTGDIMLALRNGSLRVIDLDAIDGIISFPSLHAAVAVIVPYTLRWNRPLFWPILVLDSVMLVSAIPSGNHYLSDLLGGVGVAVLAILAANTVQTLTRRAIEHRLSRQSPALAGDDRSYSFSAKNRISRGAKKPE
jgi:membrane-associated phospholipid phosphatase